MAFTQVITTTIPYVNAQPHVGFALELAQADAYARYRRLLGDKIHFQTGTDENSLKNVLAARVAGVSVQDHVDRHAEIFHSLSRDLLISHDQFVRTTSPEHHATVSEFWSRLRPDDLYRKSYGGHYCVGCEDFVDGATCADHATPPTWIEEENIFFRLSAYQDRIYDLIDSDRLRITPLSRKKEILNFISGGLQDISVSRSRTRSEGWGVEVPDDQDQIIYVWIDALINYITGLGDKKFANWNEAGKRKHFIGKNVWKFHAIYWPALLLSAGLALPDEIVIHGFLTLNGAKISKSQGATIDPFEVIREFRAESLRFYLLRGFSPFSDGDFSRGNRARRISCRSRGISLQRRDPDSLARDRSHQR